MDDALADLVASRLRIIGQPVRIRLLARLREGPASVCELTEMIDAVQQNVSQHLMILHQAGRVARQKQGKRVVYELAVADAIDGLGPLTGAVNNAGYQGVFAPVDRYPLVDARRVLEVNVLGVLNVLAASARAMLNRDVGGAIVNVASMAGVSGAPN